MRCVRTTMLLFLASWLFACSTATPGLGRGKSKGGSSSDPASEDSVSIDKPTMVGGGYVTGYLACSFESQAPEGQSPDVVGFKCRIENNGQKITLPPNSSVNHSVYDADNNKLPQDKVILEATDAPGFHWRAVIARALTANLRVETVINYDGKTLARSTYVNDPPESAGSGTGTVQQGGTHLIGQNTTYVFGATNETQQCIAERKKGGDPAVLTDANLQRLNITFNAPADTYIDVKLIHLCNLKDAEPAVLLVRAGETKAIKKAVLEKREGLNDQTVITRLQIKAGKYELQIYGDEEIYKTSFDPFSLGDIQIISSHALDSIVATPILGKYTGTPGPGK